MQSSIFPSIVLEFFHKLQNPWSLFNVLSATCSLHSTALNSRESFWKDTIVLFLPGLSCLW